MAHFRALISGARADVTRLGHKSTGVRVEAQSWQGKVVVWLEHDVKTGKDVATVTLQPHGAPGRGTFKTLYEGPVGGGEDA